MPEIAIIDDEKILVDSLRIDLTQKGYTVQPFYSAAPFLDYIQLHEPDVVFLDLQLPDMNGLEVLRRIMTINRFIPTIIITAHGNMESAVQAMKSGAYDYISKPFDLDEIGILIEKARQDRMLVTEIEHRRQRDYGTDGIDRFIGESQPVKELLNRVRKLSGIDDTTLLIRGESGTGKELLAKAIHNLSARAARQFIEINCASLPETLLESELFGFEKGAFTDAKQRKTGLVELADHGTLFLDEIGELPLPLQAKLLRFIESKSFRRIGGTNEITVNVLIITATNRDLERAMADGTFRPDLYYRLNVVPLTIPPLRERGEDIIAIAEHYLDHFAKKFGRGRLALNEGSRRALREYDWPGNVRELRNLMEMMVILNDGDVIGYDQLPEDLKTRIDRLGGPSRQASTGKPNLYDRVRQFEEDLIREALDQAGGVKAEAAKLLGISRFALLRRLKAFSDDQEA